MNKIILAITGFTLVLLAIFTINSNIDKSGILIEEQSFYAPYFEEQGLDQSLFNIKQQQWIAEGQLVLKSELNESNYLVPSSNNYHFERHWGVDRLIDYDSESNIEVTAYYFESDIYDKVILLSFSVPYHLNHGVSEDFIHLSYSNYYRPTISGAMTYHDGEDEYLLENIYPSEFINASNSLPYTINMPGVTLNTADLYTNNQIQIPYNHDSLGYFNYPEIEYSYFIQLNKSEDNQTLETDSYVGVDIDFYTKSNKTNFSVKLGFNEFKQATTDSEIYTVKRVSLSYKREDES